MTSTNTVAVVVRPEEVRRSPTQAVYGDRDVVERSLASLKQ
ncbi:hypothetical protein [Nocardiopsis lucentensis]|nr:hypothetical protein [Nocardiopsis lucentensis]